MTPRILSVDDSQTVRMALARLLRPFACELDEAANGEEGLARARQQKPDLIILDCNMPVMDGLIMLRQLREEPELRRTPVIILTAKDLTQEDLQVLHQPQVQHIFRKGAYTRVELVEAVKRITLKLIQSLSEPKEAP